MSKLKGKTAVITGCNRGIGFAIAKLFAQEGANIIACVRKPSDQTDEAIGELKKENVQVDVVYADFEDEVAVKQAAKDVKALKVPVDILVNCAGIGYLSILPFMKADELHRVFQVNYFSQVLFTQGLFTPLTKTAGSVINIASAAGIDGDIGNTVYGATKASMILFTKVLSKEMADKGVRVNAIAPGLTETDFADTLGDKAKESMERGSLFHRLAQPEEIAKTALYLASDDASFVTGQVIRVDGGLK